MQKEEAAAPSSVFQAFHECRKKLPLSYRPFVQTIHGGVALVIRPDSRSMKPTTPPPISSLLILPFDVARANYRDAALVMLFMELRIVKNRWDTSKITPLVLPANW